ncbi:MAG: serine protease [Proteobacteria bacterium]|nr:serine protease [Pseudomonadota bacterium]MBU4259860.1 serine protease [Pseudomonadota bacterium]MBU4288151.1 serine protease [Pseudomonadota bacterium]MBU4414310.1 serine protease [Pseudomonadota bacterium]MCG2757641.1 serine protease [Desulfobacteraceae bacterium]
MFINAIEKVIQFTRPIHTISRTYNSTVIQAGASSLFFVNSDGWALTCGHVAKQIVISGQVLKRKLDFEKDLEATHSRKSNKKWKKELEKKFKLSGSETYEIYNNFMNCIEGKLGADIKVHKEIDVALIHFKEYSKLLCDSFPIFAKDSSAIKPGRFVCRLGYPFAEFTNYEYDKNSDKIKWTKTGRFDTPYFPIEGMVTRGLLGKDKKIIGFELSTPGLRGQSGGPAFDVDGRILGIQAATGHLDMNFDIEQDVLRGGKKKQVKDYAFLHVGKCIHIEVIKEFMNENGVVFQEG